MRAWVFLLLAVLVGGGAYIGLWLMGYVPFFINREEVFEKDHEKVPLPVQGFPAAKTPTEAMDFFTKAIKERHYNAAATYCAGDYDTHLKKAHSAGAAVGNGVDKLLNLMRDRKLETDKGRLLLRRLDPFPPLFKVQHVQKLADGKHVGSFQVEPSLFAIIQAGQLPEFAMMDPEVLQCVLMHPLIYNPPFSVEIISEGQGEDKQWKLNLPLLPKQRTSIDHFLEKHENYLDRLDYLNQQARMGRFTEPREFENEIVRALKEAK